MKDVCELIILPAEEVSEKNLRLSHSYWIIPARQDM